MRKSEEELKRSLQALAQAAEVQISLFPKFVEVADQLVLDFEEALRSARKEVGDGWTIAQRNALETLDQEIAAQSGSEHPEVWETPECLSHPAWVAFRTSASSALSSFDWPTSPPQKSGAIYVGPPGT